MAILRMDVVDEWPVEELARTLGNLSKAYSRLITLPLIFENLSEDRIRRNIEIGLMKAAYGWDAFELVTGKRASHYDYQRPTPPLALKQIQIASPGFLEVIGAWSPLKIIADGIKDWRAENTKRQESARKAEHEKEDAFQAMKFRESELNAKAAVAYRKAELELLRAKFDFMGDALHSLDKMRGPQRDALSDKLISAIEEHLLENSATELKMLAQETRIVGLRLIEDDSETRIIPPPGQS